MSAFSHTAAAERVRDAMLGLGNRRVAEYWLTLWRGDTLPHLQDFDTARIADLATGMVAFELRPDESLICTLCGEAVRISIGMDLVGKDWLSLAAPGQRAERLKGYRAITAGAIGLGLRYGEHRSGAVHYIEEILLPFAQLASGAWPVMAHIGWRPMEPLAEAPQFRNSRSIPDVITLIPLHA